jgi:DNA replication protein DnaC
MKKAIREHNKSCEKCYGSGYIVDRKGDFSRARICDCILKCSTCKGAGQILLKNEKGYSYMDTCASCGPLRRNVKFYNLAGIPAKYSNVLQTDANFQHKNNESLQGALKYAKEEFVNRYPAKRGFLLMGKAGLGKTHLAIGAISELTLRNGIKCIFKDFFHLLSELKEAYSQGIPENEVLLPLIETEVLVIDELGKGKSSDWELNILDQLISKRYNASKTTLITTNYVTKEFATNEDKEILEDKVGSRISSRLHEMCEFIHIKGEDHRKVVKKKN